MPTTPSPRLTPGAQPVGAAPVPTGTLIRCDFCGGSGQMLGTYGDLTCPECGGEGQWEGASPIDAFHAACERAEQANERALRFLLEKQRKDEAA